MRESLTKRVQGKDEEENSDRQIVKERKKERKKDSERYSTGQDRHPQL